MFSLGDGLYFERLENGNVRIMRAEPMTTFEENGAPTQIDMNCVVSAEGWVELVAAMSARPDDIETYHEAAAIHSLEQMG